MKKLSKFDKCCIALAVGLFAAIWGYRYLPLQRCEVHGNLLVRGKVMLGYPGSAYGYVCVFPESCPEAGMASLEQTYNFERDRQLNKPIRYCPRCRNCMKLECFHRN